MSVTRILFVDDDVLNQWLLTEGLSALGFEVTGLCRGAEAIAALEDELDFDVLLTDVYMPDGVSGFELADRWRRKCPGRPIIYTSDDPQLAIGHLGSDEGFVRKFASSAAVAEIIIDLLSAAFYRTGRPVQRRSAYIN
jgi:CheY-like chemotaxis protein